MKKLVLLLALCFVVPSLAHAACSGPGAYGTAVCADSPLGYWRLDETSGTSAADSSGNGHPGTYASSGVTYSTVGPTGLGDTGVTFDGTNGNMTGLSATNNGTTAWSEEAWFEATDVTTYRQIITGTNGTNTYFHITLNLTTGTVSGCYYSAGDFCITTTGAWNDGNWHLVDYTWVNGGQKLYIDGVLRASDTQTIGLPAVNHWICGSQSGASYHFHGSETQCALYNATLSATRVLAHYQAVSVPVSGAHAIGVWRKRGGY